jgi:hypothetical protein
MAQVQDLVGSQLYGDERMAEPDRVSPSKGVGDYIRAVGAYSILLGFLGLGATIASLIWSSAYAKLQVDLRHAQDEVVQANAELSAVKSEYAQYQAQAESSPQAAGPEANVDSPEVTGSEGTGSPMDKGAMEVTVSTEGTKALFGGDLLISLVQTSFEGDPLRHKAIATVGSPGYPSAKIDRGDVGYELVYDGKGGKYAVRLASASTFSATFLVTRLSDSSEKTR